MFDNVAVAFVACEIAEKEVEVNRSVEALLLIKDEGRWRIVSQAWTRPAKQSRFPRISSAAGSGVTAGRIIEETAAGRAATAA